MEGRRVRVRVRTWVRVRVRVRTWVRVRVTVSPTHLLLDVGHEVVAPLRVEQRLAHGDGARGVEHLVRVRVRVSVRVRVRVRVRARVRVRVTVRVRLGVRVRVRGSGLGLDSLPVFHMVMAGCFSLSSWRRSDPLACGT